MSQEKVGSFPEELRRIAARADDIGGPHADQLWVRGVRRRRVQLIGYAGAVLLVISGSIAGFQTLRAAHSRVDVATPAGAEIHLPKRINDTSRCYRFTKGPGSWSDLAGFLGDCAALDR
ncbi:MAG: hypothetical protein V9E81_00090 [Marmoricola sp.]